MRVLLDECLPQRLSKEFPDHDVRTVGEMGWSGKKNGELLRLMVANEFQIFITADQNRQYEQNLRSLDVAVLVLVAKNNRLSELLPLVPSALTALESIQKGELRRVPQ